jgi:hypothetical protein
VALGVVVGLAVADIIVRLIGVGALMASARAHASPIPASVPVTIAARPSSSYLVIPIPL